MCTIEFIMHKEAESSTLELQFVVSCVNILRSQGNQRAQTYLHRDYVR